MASLFQRMRERQREGERERRRRRQQEQLNERTRRRRERERQEREQEQSRVQAEIDEREAEVQRRIEEAKARTRRTRLSSGWGGGSTAERSGSEEDGTSDGGTATDGETTDTTGETQGSDGGATESTVGGASEDDTTATAEDTTDGATQGTVAGTPEGETVGTSEDDTTTTAEDTADGATQQNEDSTRTQVTVLDGESGQLIQVGDGEPVVVTGTEETDEGIVYQTDSGSFLKRPDGTVVQFEPTVTPVLPDVSLVDTGEGQFVQVGDGEPIAVTGTEETDDGIAVYQTESGAYIRGEDGGLVPYEPPVVSQAPTTGTLVQHEDGSFLQAEDGETISITGTTETSLGVVYKTDQGNYAEGEDGSLKWIGEAQYNLNTLDGRLAAISAPYDAQLTHLNDYLDSLLKSSRGQRSENVQAQIAQLEIQRDQAVSAAAAHFNTEQEYQSSVRAFNNAIEQYNSDVAGLQAQVTDYNTTSELFELMLDPFNDLGNELSAQEAELAPLVAPITAFEEDHQDAFDSYNADFKKLEAVQSDFETARQEYDGAVEAYNGAEPPTRRMYVALQTQFDDLKATSDALNDLVASLQGRQPQIQALWDERQGYVDAYNEAATEYRSGYSQYQQLHAELRPLQEQLQTQLGQIQTLQGNLAMQGTDLQAQQAELTTSGNELNERYEDIFSGRPRQFEYEVSEGGTPSTETASVREIVGQRWGANTPIPQYGYVDYEVNVLAEDADVKVTVDKEGTLRQIVGFDDNGTAYYRTDRGDLVPVKRVSTSFHRQDILGWTIDGEPILSVFKPSKVKKRGSTAARDARDSAVRAQSLAHLQHYRETGETQWQGAGGGLPIGSTSSDDDNDDSQFQPPPTREVEYIQRETGAPTQFDLQTAAQLDDIVGPGLGTLGEEISVTAPGGGLDWARHVVQSKYNAQLTSPNLGTDDVLVRLPSVDDSPSEPLAPSPAPLYMGEGGPLRSETPTSTREERDAARYTVAPVQDFDAYSEGMVDLGRSFDDDAPRLQYDLNYFDDRRQDFDAYSEGVVDLGRSFDDDAPGLQYDLNYFDDRRQDLALQSGDDLASSVLGESGRFEYDGPDFEFDLNYFDDRRQDLALQSGDDLASSVMGESGRFAPDTPVLQYDLNYFDDGQQRQDRLDSMVSAFDEDDRADVAERRQVDLWGEFYAIQQPVIPAYNADERLRFKQGYVDTQNRQGAGFFGQLGGTLHDFGAEITSGGDAQTPTFNSEELRDWTHAQQLAARETHSTSEYLDLGGLPIPAYNADERLRFKQGYVDTQNRQGAGFFGQLGGTLHDFGAEITSGGDAQTPTFNSEELRDWTHAQQLAARVSHSTSEYTDLGDAFALPDAADTSAMELPRNSDGGLLTPEEYITSIQSQGQDSLTRDQQQVLFFLQQRTHDDRVGQEVDDWYASRERALADQERYAAHNPDSVTVARDQWLRVGTDEDWDEAAQQYVAAVEDRPKVGIAGYAGPGEGPEWATRLGAFVAGFSAKFVEPQGEGKIIGGLYDTSAEILTLSNALTPSYNPEGGVQLHDAKVQETADIIQGQTISPEEAEQQAADIWRDSGRETVVALRQQALLDNANPTMDEAMAAAAQYFDDEGREQAIARLENRLLAQAGRPQDDAGLSDWARQTATAQWEQGGRDTAIQSLSDRMMVQSNRPTDDAGLSDWARQTATIAWEETGRDTAIDEQTQALLAQANPDIADARADATTLFNQAEQDLIRSTAGQIREDAFMTPVQVRQAAETDFETQRPEMVQQVADDIRTDNQALADNAQQQAEAYYREEEPALLEETVQNMVRDGFSEHEARRQAPALLAGSRDKMIAQAAADIRSYHQGQVANADNIANAHVDSLRDSIVAHSVVLYQSSVVTNRENAGERAVELVNQYRPEWIEQTAGQIVVDRTMTPEQARQQAAAMVDANRPAAIENMASQLMLQSTFTPEQARARATELVDAQTASSIERMAGQLMTTTAIEPAQVRQIATQHVDEHSDEILRSLAGHVMAQSTLSDTAALRRAEEFVNDNESTLIASTRDLLLNPRQIERDAAIQEAEGIVGRQVAESGVTIEDGDTLSAFAENVYEQQPDLGYLGKELALSSIPIVGTVHNWDDNSNWGRGLDIALDIAGIVPVIGPSARVARSSGSLGRTAYTFASGAFMPVDPQGIRAMFSPRAVPEFGREWQRLVRMGSDPNTIPLAALENQFSTVRPPVSAFGDIPLSEKYAMRDAAVWNLAKTGRDTAVRLPDGNYMIYRGGVQQDVGEGAFHTAPSGEAFDPYFRHRDIPDDPANMYKPRHELGGDLTYEDYMLLKGDLYHSATPHTRFVPVDSSGFRTGHGRSMMLFQRDPEFMTMYKNFDIDDPHIQRTLGADTGNIPLARWSGSGKTYGGALEGELIAEGGGRYRVGVPNRYTVLDTSSGDLKAMMRPNKEWWEAALVHRDTNVPYRNPRTGEININPRTGEPFRHFNVPNHEVGLRGDSPAELRVKQEGFEFVPARDSSGRTALDADGNPMPAWNRFRDSWDWQREPVAPWQMHGKKMPWDDEVELRVAGPDFTTEQKWNLKIRGVERSFESLNPIGFRERQQGWKIRSGSGDAYVLTDEDLARWADVPRGDDLKPWDSELTDLERAESRRVIAGAQQNAAHISGARVQARLATGQGFTDPRQSPDATLERRDPLDLDQRRAFDPQDPSRQDRQPVDRDEDARRFYEQEDLRRMEELRDEERTRSRIRHQRWWDEPRVDPERMVVPRGEVARLDTPRVDTPRADPDRIEAPRTEPPRIEAPRTDPGRPEAPRGEAPRIETPRTETPRGETPRGGTPRIDAPRMGVPRLETPRITPGRSDVPRMTPARLDTPRIKPDRVDTPRTDPPRIEPPRLDVPRIDTPRIETPRLTPPGPGRTRNPVEYRPDTRRPPFTPPSKTPQKPPRPPTFDIGDLDEPVRPSRATSYPARIRWFKDEQVHELDLHTNKQTSQPALHDATPAHLTVEVTQYTEAAPVERSVELGEIDVKVGATGIQYVSLNDQADSSPATSVELAEPTVGPPIEVDVLPDGGDGSGLPDVNIVETDAILPEKSGGVKRGAARPKSVSTSRKRKTNQRKTAAPRRSHPFLSRDEQRMV